MSVSCRQQAAESVSEGFVAILDAWFASSRQAEAPRLCLRARDETLAGANAFVVNLFAREVQ